MFGPSKRELLRVIERERIQHARQVDVLLDRIASLAGNPWTLPPRPAADRDPAEDEIAIEYGELTEL